MAEPASPADGLGSDREQEEEAKVPRRGSAPDMSQGRVGIGDHQVTVQDESGDDEEMKTINADEQDEESKRTVEQRNDSDLHEFSYEGRKFYVRLNQFVSEITSCIV